MFRNKCINIICCGTAVRANTGKTTKHG